MKLGHSLQVKSETTGGCLFYSHINHSNWRCQCSSLSASGKERKNLKQEGLLAFWNKIQTHKRFKRMPFIRTNYCVVFCPNKWRCFKPFTCLPPEQNWPVGGLDLRDVNEGLYLHVGHGGCFLGDASGLGGALAHEVAQLKPHRVGGTWGRVAHRQHGGVAAACTQHTDGWFTALASHFRAY